MNHFYTIFENVYKDFTLKIFRNFTWKFAVLPKDPLSSGLISGSGRILKIYYRETVGYQNFLSGSSYMVVKALKLEHLMHLLSYIYFAGHTVQTTDWNFNWTYGQIFQPFRCLKYTSSKDKLYTIKFISNSKLKPIAIHYYENQVHSS